MPTDYEDKYVSNLELGDELVVNGGFGGNADDWEVQDGWAYGSNNVVHSPGDTDQLSQAITEVIGDQQYVVRVDLTVNAGSLTVAFPESEFDHTYTTGGIKEFTIIPPIDEGYSISFQPSEDFDGTVNNVSIQTFQPSPYSDRYDLRETEYEDKYQSS